MLTTPSWGLNKSDVIAEKSECYSTCAAESCQSAKIGLLAPPVAKLPNRRGQCSQGQDCPWHSTAHCLSLVPLVLDTPISSTPTGSEKKKNYFYLQHFIHNFIVEVLKKRSTTNTCFSSGCSVMDGGSSRYVEACVSYWKWNWTSVSSPESLWITSFSVFSTYPLFLYLQTQTNAKYINTVHKSLVFFVFRDELVSRFLGVVASVTHLSLLLLHRSGPNSK